SGGAPGQRRGYLPAPAPPWGPRARPAHPDRAGGPAAKRAARRGPEDWPLGGAGPEVGPEVVPVAFRRSERLAVDRGIASGEAEVGEGEGDGAALEHGRHPAHDRGGLVRAR